MCDPMTGVYENDGEHLKFRWWIIMFPGKASILGGISDTGYSPLSDAPKMFHLDSVNESLAASKVSLPLEKKHWEPPTFSCLPSGKLA